MKIYTILKRDMDDVAQEVHLVKVPDIGEPHFYRQGISIDSFNSREAKRRFSASPYDKPDFWYSVKHPDDIEQNEETWKRLGCKASPYANLPRVQHESIFDFYQAVGYDRKRKKFKE